MARVSVHSPNFSRRRAVTKPALRSKGGIVVAQNRVAAEIGAEVLRAGGNAVDAAVATGFAMGIAEPWMSGIGGVGGALVAKDGRVEAFDFGGVSPKAVKPEDYPIIEGAASDMFGWPAVKDNRNLKGAMALVTPGEMAGLAALHAAYGKIPWRDLVMPAARLASEGQVIDWMVTLYVAASFTELAADAGSRAVFLRNGAPPVQPLQNSGKLASLPNARLAETLEIVAREGISPFYRGEIGAALVKDIRAAGGSLTRGDLEGYSIHRSQAHVIRRAGREIHVLPELNGGPTLAAAFSKMPEGVKDDAAFFLAAAEALDFAWKDRFARLGHGGEHRAPSSTTHFSVVDRDGMMVALTQTLLTAFGSKFLSPATGILMNNGMNWFDPRPASPNRIAPGVRVLANFCPAIMTGGGEMVAIGGAGGRKIVPAIFQLFMMMADRGLEIEAAFASPRIDHSGADHVVVDRRLGEDVKAALEARFSIAEAAPCVAPYPFTIASGVARKDGMNTGITDIEHPWSEAAGETERPGSPGSA